MIQEPFYNQSGQILGKIRAIVPRSEMRGPHWLAVALYDEAKAVLFDFVDPVGMTRDLSPAHRNARSKRCCRHNGEIGLRPSECESNKPAIDAGFVPYDKLLDVFWDLSQLNIAATAQFVGNTN